MYVWELLAHRLRIEGWSIWHSRCRDACGETHIVHLYRPGIEWQACGPTLTEGEGSEYAWVFWTFAWETPTAGEHTVTSRATDDNGNVQPAPDDPLLAGKATFWESNGQITRRVRIE